MMKFKTVQDWKSQSSNQSLTLSTKDIIMLPITLYDIPIQVKYGK